MKSATKALKTNKMPLKKDLKEELAVKKNVKENKENNIQKENIRINLIETQYKLSKLYVVYI